MTTPTLNLDGYHVRILSDTEKIVLKNYRGKYFKNYGPMFSFFDNIYLKNPTIVLCPNDNSNDNNYSLNDENIDTILIPSNMLKNDHIIESHPFAFRLYQGYGKYLHSLLPIIEEDCTFSFSFEHLDIKHVKIYSSDNICMFSLKRHNQLYKIDTEKIYEMIDLHLQKLLIIY